MYEQAIRQTWLIGSHVYMNDYNTKHAIEHNRTQSNNLTFLPSRYQMHYVYVQYDPHLKNVQLYTMYCRVCTM